LGAELFLKNPFFFALTVVICISLQIWISYVSAHSILDGDLIIGFSLFLLVPLLGIIMVLYFLWFRRERGRGKGDVLSELTLQVRSNCLKIEFAKAGKTRCPWDLTSCDGAGN
jgi:hypothetical protein